MVNFFHIFICGLVMIVILGQAPQGENALLTQLNDTGFFSGYRQTKKFLRILTWTTIVGFLILEYIPSNVYTS